MKREQATTEEILKFGDKRVLIGLPVYKTISTKTAFSLIEMLDATVAQTQVIFQEGVFVHQNQNNIVDFAVENKFDYIFFVEHDMVFEPETLNKLLADDKDIICANYNFRSEPRQSMVFRFNDKGELENIPQRELPKETFQAGAIPTGLTLIKTSVFEKLNKPYFFYEYDKEGRMKTSQDVYFSLSARKAGFEVWVNPNIEVGHQGEAIY